MVEPSDRTVTGLVLPDILDNMKKKMRCIFAENHSPECIQLTNVGIMTSCLIADKSESDQLRMQNDAKQSVMGSRFEPEATHTCQQRREQYRPGPAT